MGKWVKLPVANADADGILADNSPATVTDLTGLIDLRGYRMIRVRGKFLIDFLDTTRYVWLWQSYLDSKGLTLVDNQANTSSRTDILDTGASVGINAGKIGLIAGFYGPGFPHVGTASIQNEVSIYSTRLPGPFSKFSKYVFGANAGAFASSLSFEGYME